MDLKDDKDFREVLKALLQVQNAVVQLQEKYKELATAKKVAKGFEALIESFSQIRAEITALTVRTESLEDELGFVREVLKKLTDSD